jgi:hypothetical protein
MALIEISVCLSDIPESARKKADNGKWYANFVVAERKESDKYGNTHTVYCRQTKEDREAEKPKHYVGNGKAIDFTKKPSENTPQIQKPDLPF